MLCSKYPLIVLCTLILALITALAACGGGDEPSADRASTERDSTSFAERLTTFSDTDQSRDTLPSGTERATSGTAAGRDEPDEPTPAPEQECSRQSERRALVALYNATGGPNWTRNENWLTDAPVGTWEGVSTDLNGCVTKLDLRPGHAPGNNMSGEIPAEMGNHSNLRWLSLNGSKGNRPDLSPSRLSGEIPPELGKLSNLIHLDLADNQLSGPIPPELGALVNLTWLLLENNRLSGNIPASLGNLASLEVLYLNNNQLSGEIPPELGNLATLRYLYLSGNQLTGEPPPELGKLGNLELLNLGSNSLSGKVPLELGNLSAQIDMGGNEQLCLPVDLRDFYSYMGDWQFVQVCQVTPPETLQALAALYNATDGPNWARNENWLTDAPVGEWIGVTATVDGIVTGLRLGENQLSGELPPELGNLSDLTELTLEGNDLTGEIPPELGNLSNLTKLWIEHNQFSGSIPPELGNLSNLRDFRVGYHSGLDGCVPSGLEGQVVTERLGGLPYCE